MNRHQLKSMKLKLASRAHESGSDLGVCVVTSLSVGRACLVNCIALGYVFLGCLGQASPFTPSIPAAGLTSHLPNSPYRTELTVQSDYLLRGTLVLSTIDGGEYSQSDGRHAKD